MEGFVRIKGKNEIVTFAKDKVVNIEYFSFEKKIRINLLNKEIIIPTETENAEKLYKDLESLINNPLKLVVEIEVDNVIVNSLHIASYTIQEG